MAVVSSSITMPEEVIAEIDATAKSLLTSRSELLRRAWITWKSQQSAPVEQPRVVTINGITYTQTEIAEAA